MENKDILIISIITVILHVYIMRNVDICQRRTYP